MKKPLYQVYGNRKPDGVACINNFGGLVTYWPEPDDTETDIVTAWCFDGVALGFHRNKIYYTTSGRAYLRKGNTRFYLDEIMRV